MAWNLMVIQLQSATVVTSPVSMFSLPKMVGLGYMEY